MKHLLLTPLLLLSMNLSAQIIDSSQIDFRPYKGKLIVINESHNVKTNNEAYYDIITKISKQLDKGDSINFIVEYPYSLSVEINRVKENDTSTVPHQFNYTNLPVRFIGVDFERPYKKEYNTYLLLLSRLIATLKEKQLLTKDLQEYYDLAEKRYVILKDNSRKPIITHYKKEREKFGVGSAEHQTITQLLFLLTADHNQLPNVKKRDSRNYRRLLEADKNGMISFKGNYNILVHGTCHTDPTKKKGIYNHFLARKDSPFRNNTYMTGQAYIDCVSAGDYFRDTARTITGSIFCGGEEKSLLITDYFRNRYKGVLQPGTLLMTRSANNMPEWEVYKGRFIGWHVHWKAPLEKNP